MIEKKSDRERIELVIRPGSLQEKPDLAWPSKTAWSVSPLGQENTKERIAKPVVNLSWRKKLFRLLVKALDPTPVSLTTQMVAFSATNLEKTMRRFSFMSFHRKIRSGH